MTDRGAPRNESHGVTRTEYVAPPPALSEDDQRLLQVLAEPILHGDAMTPAASTATVASVLGLDDGSVEKWVGTLAVAFGLGSSAGADALVHEALRRGAIAL